MKSNIFGKKKRCLIILRLLWKHVFQKYVVAHRKGLLFQQAQKKMMLKVQN